MATGAEDLCAGGKRSDIGFGPRAYDDRSIVQQEDVDATIGQDPLREFDGRMDCLRPKTEKVLSERWWRRKLAVVGSGDGHGSGPKRYVVVTVVEVGTTPPGASGRTIQRIT